ncbi:MAG: hypothetical protein DRP15_03165 [Candidatus Aenigmatarchaeota archaeon]|nr:MAG: hypothetical protein DRP15_03165 [Candidatus Aenigmarchaeota archaeon]
MKLYEKKGKTEFYGFITSDNEPGVIVIQRSDWYVAGIKPWYDRLIFFKGFKLDDETFENIPWKDMVNGNITISQYLSSVMDYKDKLKELFNSKLSVRKLKKIMNVYQEYRDSDFPFKYNRTAFERFCENYLKNFLLV